jgi:hypothetical protein
VQGAELTSETQHQLEAFGFVSFRKVEDGFFAAKDPHAA